MVPRPRQRPTLHPTAAMLRALGTAPAQTEPQTSKAQQSRPSWALPQVWWANWQLSNALPQFKSNSVLRPFWGCMKCSPTTRTLCTARLAPPMSALFPDPIAIQPPLSHRLPPSIPAPTPSPAPSLPFRGGEKAPGMSVALRGRSDEGNTANAACRHASVKSISDTFV